jgi:hypothetical protein
MESIKISTIFRSSSIDRCRIPSWLNLLDAKSCSFDLIKSKEDLNIVEVFMDSIKEKNSASNDPICDDSKLDFDWQSGPKLLFRACGKCFRSLLLCK